MNVYYDAKENEIICINMNLRETKSGYALDCFFRQFSCGVSLLTFQRLIKQGILHFIGEI